MFSGSVAEIYDTYLVPLIFDGYAADLAARIASLEPKHVLETAAGTGVVTRAMAAKLDPQAQLIATDLAEPMLDRARRVQPLGRQITWRQADALSLPFGDRSFDAIVCQFGAMFFPDKIAGYTEARRVLKEGGSFLFNVWDRIEANEFADVVTKAMASVFPNDPPRFLAQTPHGYHDVERIRNELAQAGFSRISVSTIENVSTAPSPLHAAIAYCQGTPLRNEIETRDAGRLEDATDRAAEAISERFGNGPVSGKICAHVFAAR